MKKIIEAMNSYKNEIDLPEAKQSSIWEATIAKMKPETSERKATFFKWFSANFVPLAITVVVASSLYAGQSALLSKRIATSPVRQDFSTTSDSKTGAQYAPAMALQERGPVADIINFVQKSTGYANVQNDDSTKESSRIKDLNSELRYTVANVSDAVKKLYSLIVDYKGYVIESHINTGRSNFVFKVPIEKFQEFRQQVNLIGSKLTYEQTNTVDKQNELTSLETGKNSLVEKIKDLEAKIKAAKTEASKTSLKKELEQAQRSLTSQGNSIKTLKQATSMATVYVEFTSDKESFISQLQETLGNTMATLGKILIVVLNWGIIAIAVGIPIKFAMIGFQRIFKKKKAL